MAKLTFTEDDIKIMALLAHKFDPETYPELEPFADTMPADDWHFTCDYMRRRLHETIVGCLCARAYLEGLIERGMVTDKGLEQFFHGGIDGAQRNFGNLDGPEELAFEMRYVDICIRQQRQVRNESGMVDHSELGEIFSSIQTEVEGRVLGDLDPWGDPRSRIRGV